MFPDINLVATLLPTFRQYSLHQLPSHMAKTVLSSHGQYSPLLPGPEEAEQDLLGGLSPLHDQVPGWKQALPLHGPLLPTGSKEKSKTIKYANMCHLFL